MVGQKDDEDDTVEGLLRLPFDEALARCSGLLKHISSQDEDAESIAQEFRAHWGPRAPPELREVLREAAGSPAMRDDLDSILPRTTTVERSSGEEAESVEERTERLVRGMRGFLSAPEFGTIEWGGWLPGERLVPAEFVDDLLRLPFGDALACCPALRRHLEDQEDPDAVETELRDAWGPHAPAFLREVLAQLLSLEPIEDFEDANVESESRSSSVDPESRARTKSRL